MLAPYLRPENADELLAAAAHRSKAELERLLAERFPRPELPARVEALSPPLALGELAPGTVEAEGPGEPQLAPGTVEPPTPRPRLAPLAPQRYALQFTIGQETYDRLGYAQALLGHALPSGDVAAVFDRALDALIGQLERSKFAATTRPRPQPRPASADPRHIPAEVKRTVWQRDGGQCTFVGDSGQRCPARTRLEFDHVVPVARGGQAT